MHKKGAMFTLRGALKYFLAAIVFLLIAELSLRATYFVRNSLVGPDALPSVMEAYYGPKPPWNKRKGLLTLDDKLIFKGTPYFHGEYIEDFRPFESEDDHYLQYGSFIPNMSDHARKSPTWEIKLNSEGFRDDEFQMEKNPHEFRIVCLGDSWTVGLNINLNETYPYILGAILKEKYPDEEFRVFNLGVSGYSSYQGLKLIRRALELQPDVIVIGFAMNEVDLSDYVDYTGGSDSFPTDAINFISNAGSRAAENIELFKLVRYWALQLRHKPTPMDVYFNDLIAANEYYQDIKDSSRHEPWFKEILALYEQNLLRTIKLAKGNNIATILLYPEFSTNGPFLKVLQRISEDEKLPLVDGSNLIAESKREIEETLEEELGLHPETKLTQSVHPNGELEVIFRVYVDAYPMPDKMYITGNAESLDNLTPNKIAMYDDGTHGDQRVGDRVWSYSAKFPPDAEIYYLYTNSGKENAWKGLDVPDIRYIKAEAQDKEQVVYAPIDSFGRMYLKADPWHTDAEGNRLFAEAIVQKLTESKTFQSYMARNMDTIQ